MSTEKPPFERKTFVTGVCLALIGAFLLFWNQNFVEGLLRWWPAAFTFLGALALYKALRRKGKPRYLFWGILLFSTGVFMLLQYNLFDPVWGLKMDKLWPVFMGIAGFSMIPYGLRHGLKVQVSLLVPGIAFIFLAVVFLIFLNFNIEFKDFVIQWWPLILVFMGLSLILGAFLHADAPNEPHEPNQADRHDDPRDGP